MSKDLKAIRRILKEMDSSFHIDIYEPVFMVGMEIERPHPTGPIKLTQRFHIENLVKFTAYQSVKRGL